MLNQFNSQIHEFRDPENIAKCTYYNLEEVQTMRVPNKKVYLFIPYCSNNHHLYLFSDKRLKVHKITK